MSESLNYSYSRLLHPNYLYTVDKHHVQITKRVRNTKNLKREGVSKHAFERSTERNDLKITSELSALLTNAMIFNNHAEFCAHKLRVNEDNTEVWRILIVENAKGVLGVGTNVNEIHENVEHIKSVRYLYPLIDTQTHTIITFLQEDLII